MPDLVVICPSRRRPAAAAELALACQKTRTADTVLLVVVDVDDPTLNEYAAPAGTSVFFTHAPADSGHVGAINWGAARALADFAPFAVAKLDDDHRPRTQGWDTLLLAALRDLGTGIVYGNDLLQGANLPTALAVTADIPAALGHLAPPVLRHLYCDNYWKDLGEAAGCLRYLPDVVLEHMHPVAGKADWDEGYRRVNDPGRYEADGAAYRRYHADGSFAADVARVKALVRGRQAA
jgi:hypothetical protein